MGTPIPLYFMDTFLFELYNLFNPCPQLDMLALLSWMCCPGWVRLAVWICFCAAIFGSLYFLYDCLCCCCAFISKSHSRPPAATQADTQSNHYIGSKAYQLIVDTGLSWSDAGYLWIRSGEDYDTAKGIGNKVQCFRQRTGVASIECAFDMLASNKFDCDAACNAWRAWQQELRRG